MAKGYLEPALFNERNNKLQVEIEILKDKRVATKYDKEYEALADSIRELRTQRHSVVENSAERQGKRQRIAEMTEFLQNQSGEITEYDDKLDRQLVERVTVFENSLKIESKSGVEIEEEI